MEFLKDILFSIFKLLFIILINSLNLYADEQQTWIFSHFNFIKESNKEVTLSLHSRVIDGDEINLYQIQPKYAFQLQDYFWASLNYSFFGIRRATALTDDEDIFSNQHRTEFEIQPRFKFLETLRYSGRNRFEYLMDEDFNYLNKRFRHRSQISYENFKDQFGLLITQTEAFYDFGASRWNQYRTVPVGVRILFDSFSISLLPTILSLNQNSDWNHSFVSTIEFSFDF